jgi:2-(1,2-epoxy-1,2-dihydrophenyl)acetyl-CoA isomerase
MSTPYIQLATVDASLDGATVTIRLNRPEALNAWNAQLGGDLLEALRRATDDEAVRAIVLTGAGRAFSSGADLKDFSGGMTTPDGRPDVYRTLTERYHPIMKAIRSTAPPSASAARWPCAAT